MNKISKIVFSDEALIRHGQSWPNVPLILINEELAVEPSEWILDLRIRACADNTLISYAKTLALWLEALNANKIDWRSTNQSTAERFCAVLAREGSAPSTIKLRMTHIQEFYRWAEAKGYIKQLPFHIQRADRVVPAGKESSPALRLAATRRRKVKPQSMADFDKVLSQTSRKTSALALRDELIAEAARFMGLRRSEVAELTTGQFLALKDEDEVHVIEIVTAKSRGRIDTVMVPAAYAKKMKDFILIQRAAMVERFKELDEEYVEPPNVFLTERGKNQGQAVTGNYIGDSWRRMSLAAGLDTRFHDNRSSFATNVARAAREAGADPRVIVKELLRHSSEKSGEVYVAFDKMESEVALRARIVNDAVLRDKKGEA